MKSKIVISEQDEHLDKVIINGLTRRQMIERSLNDSSHRMDDFEKRIKHFQEVQKEHISDGVNE
jgi:hypothetical protein